MNKLYYRRITKWNWYCYTDRWVDRCQCCRAWHFRNRSVARDMASRASDLFGNRGCRGTRTTWRHVPPFHTTRCIECLLKVYCSFLSRSFWIWVTSIRYQRIRGFAGKPIFEVYLDSFTKFKKLVLKTVTPIQKMSVYRYLIGMFPG